VPIVGVVGDVKEQGQGNPTNLEMYRPYEQASYAASMTLMVRSQTDPESLASSIRKEVWNVDKNVPVEDVQTLNQVISRSVSSRRSMLFLVTVFAGIALLLGLTGIYGLISYFVSLHIPEIGVRMALGAQKSSILKMVIRQGSFPVFVGTVIGLAGSVAFSRLMTKLLFGVHPTDPFVLAAVAFLLIATALFSSCIPAYRATRLNVVQALRAE
jgi:putative ABC transport system permease protein